MKPLKDIVRSILDGYDFVGVQEYMDESLVALKMILGLELTDILYVSSKANGGFDELCHYIVPPFLSLGMKAYFNSTVWSNRYSVDELLYQSAVESQQFEAELQKYHQAQELVNNHCPPAFVCDAAGKRNGASSGCLRWDLGCWYLCIESPEFEALASAQNLLN